MVRLSRSDVDLTLKEIGLIVFQAYGNPTGKPYDHSTILHHLKGQCTCEKNEYEPIESVNHAAQRFFGAK